MDQPHSHMNAMPTDRHQTVRVPRASDGIGNALRQLYGRQPAAPEDMMRLLERLDRD